MTTMTILNSVTLNDYVELCGGSDVLFFETGQEAVQAARTLRSRLSTAEYSVEARYTKVIIRKKR